MSHVNKQGCDPQCATLVDLVRLEERVTVLESATARQRDWSELRTARDEWRARAEVAEQQRDARCEEVAALRRVEDIWREDLNKATDRIKHLTGSVRATNLAHDKVVNAMLDLQHSLRTAEYNRDHWEARHALTLHRERMAHIGDVLAWVGAYEAVARQVRGAFLDGKGGGA